MIVREIRLCQLLQVAICQFLGILVNPFTIIKFDFNVDHSESQDRKKLYEFGKEMKINMKHKGQKVLEDYFL